MPHDDVIKWKHFPHNWTLVRGIHRSPVNSPHKGQWRGVLVLSLICAWKNGWVNNRGAGDLRHRRAHYDVTVIYSINQRQGQVITSHSICGTVYVIICISNLIIIPLRMGQTQIYIDKDNHTCVQSAVWNSEKYPPWPCFALICIPLSKSKRNCFCNVEMWKLNSIYRFAISRVAVWSALGWACKISEYSISAFGICSCLKSAKFEKCDVKITD